MTAAQLCPVVEGVQFLLREGVAPVRGLILRDALEAIFDATEDPQSWLRAFERNRDEIMAVAESLLATLPGQKLVLLRWRHFQVLPQYADRPENPAPSPARLAA